MWRNFIFFDISVCGLPRVLAVAIGVKLPHKSWTPVGYFVYTHRLEVSRDNFRSTVVNHTKRPQSMPYDYILMCGARCKMSHNVSRFLVTRRATKVKSSVLSSLPRAPFRRFHNSTTKSRDNLRTSLIKYIHLHTHHRSRYYSYIPYFNISSRKGGLGWRAELGRDDKWS